MFSYPLGGQVFPNVCTIKRAIREKVFGPRRPPGYRPGTPQDVPLKCSSLWAAFPFLIVGGGLSG